MALQKVQPARESVPSRLGQLPRVERDFLDALAEALPEVDGEGIPCVHLVDLLRKRAAGGPAVHLF